MAITSKKARTGSMEIARQLELDFAKDFSNILVKRNVLSLSEFKSIQRRIPKPFVAEKTKDSPNECDKHELVIVNAQKTESPSSFAIESLPTEFEVVIIAEAHHYPADSWQTIVDHFFYSRTIFLTASPKMKEGNILINHQQKLTCYEMSRSQAIEKGLVRKIVPSNCGTEFEINFEDQCKTVGTKILQILNEHDQLDPKIKHQAIIFTNSNDEAITCVKVINSLYNENMSIEYTCGDSDKSNLTKFVQGEMKIMVLCGTHLEACDRSQVSAIGILTSFKPSSHVLFNQIVGRCVKKCYAADPVDATIVLHVALNLEANYNNFIGLDNEELVTEIL